MALPPGARLGPYEVVTALGAGGMGEVYKARDTRLERTVAIKILPSEVAGDADRRARFEREARAIAALDHPHICGIYDVGSVDGTHYLVMPHLDGQTLAARLEKGPLPLDQALKIAIEIADALAAAHHAGVVHRDLKPANVVLTKSGAKLLDFGLAKTAAPAVVAGGMSTLPTTSPQTLTARGMILGTFQYMAPEQIEGVEADARTDVFAFGCVLYEMLTGLKAFEGKTHASLIAAILEREPPAITALQPLAPPLVDAIVRKCLAKKPADRWQSAADLASALQWVADQPSGAAAGATAVAGTPPLLPWRMLTISALAGMFVALAAGVIAWRYAANPTPATSVRFEIIPAGDVMLSPSPVASAAQLAISPDGRTLAFVAAPKHGVSQLWVRPLNAVQARPLDGTEGASFPFWSPDNRSIGFFAGGKLKRVDIMGGAPQVLCSLTSGRGASWSPDGKTIVFAPAPRTPLSQVAAEPGGTVRPVTTFNREEDGTGHTWPQFLPDGRHFLFYQISTKPEHQGIYVGSLDSTETLRVVSSTSAGLYSSGYILFERDGILFAQAFDEKTFRTQGEVVQIADHVGHFSATFGYMAVSVSTAGVLAYGPSVAVTTSLQWRDRDKPTTGSAIAPGVYRSPRLSSDETRVLVSKWEPQTGQSDIQMLRLALRNEQRQTFDPLNDWFPAWSPDGSEIFFGSSRNGAVTRMFRRAENGQEEPIGGVVGSDSFAQYPNDTSSDGKFLSYTQSSPSGYDVGFVPLSGDSKTIPILASSANEVQARFAPNGRWLAYASDETGKFEVYVRPFPGASPQTLISDAGGMQPEWRRDGKELFYVSADRKLMAVPVTTDGAKLSNGTPRALFDVQIPEPTPPYPTDYAVAADGQRFLVNTVVDQPVRPALTVIVNWTAELRK